MEEKKLQDMTDREIIDKLNYLIKLYYITGYGSTEECRLFEEAAKRIEMRNEEIGRLYQIMHEEMTYV